MSDEVARAVGAGNNKEIEIAGKQYKLRPLNVRELCEIERECLRGYKREYLRTFSENYDLLPEGVARDALIQSKFDEVAKWDIDDLPARFAYDIKKVEINDKLKAFVDNLFPGNKGAGDAYYKRVVATCLDQGMLDEGDYIATIGKPPGKLKVGYVNWWITGSMAGMTAVVYACFKAAGCSREDIEREMSENPTKIMEAVRDIEAMSAPRPDFG